MATAVNIVIADAQATPVNHTFVPLGPDPKDNTVFWFEDQSQAAPIGYWRLSVQLKRPPIAKGVENSSSRIIRAVIGMHQPTLENVTNSTVSGIAPAPTLSYTPRCFAEFVLPERSSLQNRKDLRKMMALALANTQVIDSVENLLPLY
jgi:hypothetical protein